MLVSGVIMMPFPLIYLFAVPESYRFLISKDRLDEASASFGKFPVKPGCQATLIVAQNLLDEKLDNENHFLESIASIVSIQTQAAQATKRGNGPMIFTFIILNVVWVTTSIMFNGLLFFVDKLPGSPFLNTYYTTILDSFSACLTFAIMPRYSFSSTRC